MPQSSTAPQRPALLTKSRFKRALECPAKLFYAEQSSYANQSLEDDFLAELAKGGHQVGALAKCYFPGGEDLAGISPDEALVRTQELLQRDQVTIFEAAIQHGHLLVRVDILVKDAGRYQLIEVKAKSCDPLDLHFMKKRGEGIVKDWEPYLCDVAFQKVVLEKALNTRNIDSYLMLANKRARAATDGLNSKFRVAGDHSVIVSPELSKEDLAVELLAKIDASEPLDYIRTKGEYHGHTFEGYIATAADALQRNECLRGCIGAHCKKCEFRCTLEDESNGLQSGFRECWKEAMGWQDQDFEDPLVLEIANFRKADKLLAQGKAKMIDLEETDISPAPGDKPGMSNSERQWLQVSKIQKGDATPEIDIDGLRAEMQGWTYPLHFIDFETITAALPFTSGRRPYEGVAFQFSHHVVHKDGSVVHAHQFLDTEPGHFPSFDFIRALKQALEGDSGTIFRYAAHENSFLNLIHSQLRDSDLPQEEVKELCAFIESISHSKDDSELTWCGPRDMVDLLELVKRYAYYPQTRGSNSIKHVLPAVLNHSAFLQEKYGQPNYGATGGIPSFNFQNWQWIQVEHGQVRDPYKLLPKMFEDVPENIDELLSEGDSLANGGAALTAYARIQFTEMSDYEREQLRSALLKYCELDTLAMVMIYESWVN
ncbi:DUF2779 domain-containing protein [Microbulbifer hydrolyticus]|uniref:DUF2779 domain-containing protein n=1 Tax=Microbulbifer hydrolyticus TaxID=48074 RepID=A0A6P1T944_9GAMM|nr:DUF2779 domain-containing protein [Microbulbifer hydrolyticus]MBB5211480.1 hypothetical protein [Microbulbifer hydrolyticus]QHQ37769.1 DUF2779 domain-containing protein [Microbulbifer hydrolyticus]